MVDAPLLQAEKVGGLVGRGNANAGALVAPEINAHNSMSTRSMRWVVVLCLKDCDELKWRLS